MISGFWRVSSWLLAGLLLLPLATVFVQAFFMTGILSDPQWAVASDVENFSRKLLAEGRAFTQLWRSGLPVYLLNSAVLVTGTVLLSLLIGLPAAWLMAMYRFPGQRILGWALCLPLAMPAFLLAYLYADIAAPLQTLIGLSGSVAVPCGACVVLALALYPYIYLLVRHALAKQPASLIHSARMLKLSHAQVIKRVCLPIARPAMVTGAILVAVEAFGDYGAASYLALPTLTTAVLDIWQQQGDLGAAARIAVIILPFIFLLMYLAHVWRRKNQIYQARLQAEPLVPPRLRGWRSGLAQFYCWSLVCLAFIFPLLRLAWGAMGQVMPGWDQVFLLAIGNSVLISTVATALITLMAISFVFYTRTVGPSANQLPMRLIGLSLAIPGAVLAVGWFIPLVWIGHGLGQLAQRMTLSGPEMWVSGSLFILMLVYSAKFARLMLDGLEYRMATIPLSLDRACLVLKCSARERWSRVHLPLLRRALLVGALLVFTESMKELNVSLLLRPLHLEMLATYVFRLTSGEPATSLALPALVLVLVGMVPVVGLIRVLNIKG
ncbi:iron(III) transport system permease protein|uniref:Iron(III) transport system permease protein n=2 Tax=Brenneria salicis TaxID=55214 RepID=A0A366I5A3_9GAMM|nr:iron ABC transporter permease [Brenneria salicis]NMN90788.1 iron(III) transport system permease protein [Brenneria salicis ATCC 15712 = DSM 30166]RBP63509.1 iron(III) transport system permease protein [Brenneria salicis ATCC 15712 = DSM 30166]RLM30989.1 ABC transporter permease [Brenneria salicis ATCC 15712 = DSM 30166]